MVMSSFSTDEIILFTFDDFELLMDRDITKKEWIEFKDQIEKIMKDFIETIKEIEGEKNEIKL